MRIYIDYAGVCTKPGTYIQSKFHCIHTLSYNNNELMFTISEQDKDGLTDFKRLSIIAIYKP